MTCFPKGKTDFIKKSLWNDLLFIKSHFKVAFLNWNWIVFECFHGFSGEVEERCRYNIQEFE